MVLRFSVEAFQAKSLIASPRGGSVGVRLDGPSLFVLGVVMESIVEDVWGGLAAMFGGEVGALIQVSAVVVVVIWVLRSVFWSLFRRW